MSAEVGTNRYEQVKAVPSLEFVFTGLKKSMTDRISGKDLITFTRTTVGTYVDENGVIQTADINEPRFDYDPETGESLGLLIEESRTNLIEYSDDITNDWWSLRELDTSLVSSVNNPLQNAPAYRVRATNVLANHRLQGSSISLAANTDFTVSAFVSPEGIGIDSGLIQIRIAGIGLSTGVVNFNLNTGQYNLANGASGTSTSTGISWSISGQGMEPYANGWYRIWATFQANATSNARFVNIDSMSAADSSTSSYEYVGSTTGGYYIAGIQVEQGSFPTSYIPTTGGTLTRGPDLADITGTDFSSWYNQIGGTLVTNSRVYPLPLNFTQRPYCAVIMNSNGSQYWGQTWENCGDGKARVDTTAGAQASNTGLNLQTDQIYNIFYKSALGVEFSGDVNVNGIGRHSNQGLTATSVSVPKNTALVDRLTFGTSINGNGQTGIWQGHISRLTYWPVRLADNYLQELTQ